MRRIIQPLVYAFVFFLSFASVFVARHAFADSGSAGSGSALIAAGSGSGSAIAAPPVLHDLSNPTAVLSDLEAAKRLGWVVLAFAVLVLLSRGVGLLGKDIPKLAWLNTGKWAVVIGGVGALGLAGYNAAALGGSFYAVFGALVTAGLAFYNAEAKPPAAPTSEPAKL